MRDYRDIDFSEWFEPADAYTLLNILNAADAARAVTRPGGKITYVGRFPLTLQVTGKNVHRFQDPQGRIAQMGGSSSPVRYLDAHILNPELVIDEHGVREDNPRKRPRIMPMYRFAWKDKDGSITRLFDPNDFAIGARNVMWHVKARHQSVLDQDALNLIEYATGAKQKPGIMHGIFS